MGIKIGNTDISSIILGPSVQPTPRLPVEYQEVEYIESNGEQAIDTGFKPLYEEEYRAVVDFEWMDQDTGGHLILGHMRNCGAGFNGGDFAITRDSGGSRIGPSYGGFTSATFTPNTYGYNTRYTFDGTWNSGQVDAMTNLVIFARRTSGVSGISMKLYSCDIYKDNDKIAEYVPCFRKSDGEIGLYNLIDDTFLANAGSGAFTKGPPLGCKSIKKVYRGSTLIRPGPNLLSYQEIIDMGENDLQEAIDELNSHQTSYYNKFQSEGHIYTEDGVNYLGVSGEGLYVMGEGLMTYTEAMDMFGEYFTIKYDPEGPIYGYTVWTEEMVGHEVPDDSL